MIVPSVSLPPVSSPVRIAVISDTHDHCPADLPGRLLGADEIWHIGDVCAPATLVELEALGIPLHVVRGNNDEHPWPLTLRLVRGGRVFHLEHIAPRRAYAGVDFMLSGHTHVPTDTTDTNGVRWLNPGCIIRPRARVRTFAWLTVGAEGAVGWEWIEL